MIASFSIGLRDCHWSMDTQSVLKKWLEGFGIGNATAKAIVDRLPSYFVYALNHEWRRNAKSYRPLIEAIDTPFAKAGDREWAWTAYSAFLRRKIEEGVFDEPFSLSQIYVPLNAFYFEETARKEATDEMVRHGRQRRRVVVSLQDELEQWLQKPNAQDAIRVISGGPGSGKSSFARIFAARVAQQRKLKVLFVPLHLIDPAKDLIDEVGRFVRDEGILIQNPLDPDSPEPSLLIIFDGLDELASQGKAAAQTASAFVREVEKTVERRNQQSVKLRVLISGRELVVQENESEFRRPRQILTLLPYFVSGPEAHDRHSIGDREGYHDPSKLLKADLRQQWWKNYGAVTGKGYNGLPEHLSRDDLAEVTAQPLLNYLVALSFSRDKLDFTKDINLNSIYADLVAAVHERGYEKHRPYVPIRHMKVDDFSRVLEEIGLAAWHGDGRTTTVKEIEEHCRASGLGVLLDVFQDGAKAGVTRLLAAFFFRQYGQRASGDPTFVFTHKSFGEYLTARRVVRAVERVIRELKSRAENPDGGWDERDALKHWAQVCGPTAITPYLHAFLLNELELRAAEEVILWQEKLARLFSYSLKHGMPMEQLQVAPFKEALFQSRNAEEALLVVLNACARVSNQVSEIVHPDSTTFGTWFRRIQGQRIGPETCLAGRCLSWLNLRETTLHISDFYQTDLQHSDLSGVEANIICLGKANLSMAKLVGAHLWNADLTGANLSGADFERARLSFVKFQQTDNHPLNRTEVDLRGANLRSARLEEVDLNRGNLEGANLEGANLEGAYLQGANLQGANLQGANLQGAKLPPKLRVKSKRTKPASSGK